MNKLLSLSVLELAGKSVTGNEWQTETEWFGKTSERQK